MRRPFLAEPETPGGHFSRSVCSFCTNPVAVGKTVEVVYASRGGNRVSSTGRVRLFGEDSLTIGKGLWHETIAFDSMI